MTGQILGHYRVLDQLGAGGMGVVYRAYDEQLDRNVALKVLPPGLLADEDARKRFRKEALALAKLNHPNVETIYEFGSQDGIDFLAMELIPGVPLNEKLKNGPLSERDLMRFGVQLADGLAAAHEQGIIHSDLKPGNIFITADNRLKILDFGLARLLKAGEDNDITQTITAQSGAIAGTLPYMSPEQLRAEPTDGRSDIYAAGTVLYEMATGTRPFTQNQTAQLIGAILHTEPPRPETINPNIQPGIEAVITKALDKSPSERYQTARELRTALETLTTNPFLSSRAVTNALLMPSSATAVSATIPPQRRLSRSAIVASGIGITVIAAFAVMLAFDFGGLRSKLFHSAGADASSASPPTSSLPARHAVAVLSLVNSSKQPDQAWLSATLQQMLGTELGAGGNVRVISGEDVARMKSDLALPDADSYGRDTLGRIQKNLGADDVVTGSYVAPGNGELRLDLRLQDARTGETIVPLTVTGRGAQVSDLVAIVTSAGVQLREKLGVEGAPPMADASLKASMPASSAAAQLYAEGIARLHAFDAQGAVDPLQRAVKKEPNYALAHSALAEAWSALGYDQRAKDEDTLALSLAGSLSAEERGMIQGRVYEFSSQWDKAATYYLSLHTLAQDDIEYGLRQANAQIRGGNPKAALTTISELRTTPGPAGQDPRIDLAEADAAEMLGDFKDEEAAAARAADKANQLGIRRVAADAEWHQCTALVNQGNGGAAKAACEKARDAARVVKDPLLEARSLTGLGYAFSDEGAMDPALECHQQALKLAQGIGAQRDIAGALLNIGNLKYASGSLKEANDYYHRSLATSQLINNKQGILDAEAGLAPDLYAAGKYEAAQQIYADMLKTAREVGDKKNSAFALNGTALVLFQLGDLSGSHKYIDDALRASDEADMKADHASWLCSLGDIQFAEDRLDLAGKTYDESSRSSEQLGATSGVADANVALANLALEKKDPAKSESLARQAADMFHKEKNADSEADALNSVARALLAENKVPDARKVIDSARNLPAQDQSIRLSIATTAAQVDALEGKSAEALQTLDAVIAKAKEIKLKREQLEARLAKATIQREVAERTSALPDLKSLHADANATGFRLIARKASELANRPAPKP